MAPAREDDNSYENGLGVGGKLRKPRFRRSQATPYDRPQTATRNPTHAAQNNSRNGWLAKLVDPAHRLITSTAHSLFASFLKRLPPLPTTPSSPAKTPPLQKLGEEARQEVGNMAYESGSTLAMREDKVIPVGDVNASEDPSDRRKGEELTELEQILQQRTFTRYEIDRLTSLLRSRSLDASDGIDEQKTEANHLKTGASYKSVDEALTNPARENGKLHHLTSAPLAGSNVLGEEIASPAELAKAYMCSRPSEVSPSASRLRNQAAREDSVFCTNKTSYPVLSRFSGLSGQVGLPENGLFTPRSRGRSAVYSMARTPYSRPPSAFKGGLLPSSSRSGWEDGAHSVSREQSRMGLKRRNNVLDSDIGSVGPVRRIRQKSNLLSARNLGESPLSIQASNAMLVTKVASSSRQKSVISGDSKHSYPTACNEIAENRSSGQTFATVPSKSSETASKILQQLDKLVSTRDKSPTKLSPSMLHGAALKSLQSVDSSKLLENLQDNSKAAGSVNLVSDAQESGYPNQEKFNESGSRKLFASGEKSAPAPNGVDVACTKMDHASNVKVLDRTDLAEQLPPPKKRAFRMSANEDFLDLDDDDDDQNGAATSSADEREKLTKGKTTGNVESAKGEKAFAFTGSKRSENLVSNGNSHQMTHNGSLETEKRAYIASDAAVSSGVKLTAAGTKSDAQYSTVLTEQSSAAPAVFSFGDKGIASAESSGSHATLANASTSSASNDSMGPISALFSYTKPSSLFAGPTDSLPKISDSNKTTDESSSKAAGLVTSVASSSIGGALSFGTTASDSSPIMCSSAISLVTTAPQLASNVIPCSAFSTTLPTNSCNVDLPTSTHSSIFSPVPAPSSANSAPNFKFGASVTYDPVSTESVTTTESKEARDKESTTVSLTSPPFGGAPSSVATMVTSISSSSSAITSAASSLFGVTPSVMGAASTSGATSFVAPSTGSGIFGLTSSTAAGITSGVSGETSSATVASGSSALTGTSNAATPVFATPGGILSGGALSSSGGSIFGFNARGTSSSNQSQSADHLIAENAQTGLSTSTKSMPIQFGSSTSTPSFGLSGNASFSTSSSAFASSSSGSLLFSFGATTAPQQGSSSPLASSTSSASTTTSNIFGSGWQAPKAPSFSSSFPPSSSPGFVFGASSVSSTGSGNSPFGLSSSASTPGIFNFSSTAAASAPQPVFGNAGSGFQFSATAPSSNGNNDQMSMEDSMAEDTDQAKASLVPSFGQPPVTPSQPTFAFGAAAPTGASPFQFGGQANLGALQSPSPFQASGSMEFNAGASFGAGPSGGGGGSLGGSFSLGSAGDKSSRRIVKVRKQSRRR